MVQSRSRSRIVAETPPDANCFIGFHDFIPWSQDESCIVIHRADPAYFEMSDCDKPIDICLWYPQTGEIRVVDTTRAWNFQQGSRLQWMPGRPDTIVFNDIEDGRAVSVLRNVVTGERRVLPAPIYVFSPDGKVSISPNFTTLAHRWKAYGYVPLEATPPIPDQDADGIWQLDIETGKESLFISTKRAAEFQAVPNAHPSGHFLCHVSISPDGSRVIFLHRFFSADGGLFTRMIATDREAKELVLLGQEKVSHFDWFDNDTVLVWARFTGGGLAQFRSRGLLNSPLVKPLLRIARSCTGRWKRNLLSEAYYKIPVKDPKARVRFGWPSLDRDGHPMIARSHNWILTDFYPDKNGRLPVILYDPTRNLRVDAQMFSHHPRDSDTDVKCDLHPRWNRSERLVAVDTCEAGYRQVRVLDVSDILG
ncbi:MAG: hypothetical protein WBM14_08130 [Terracidiphilus sp.]|jgi:hypothetical protein